MIKKIINKVFEALFSKEYKDLYKIVDKYEYISFDIFDTLIKRNIKNPTDIFTIIENKYKVKDFKNKRINAEKEARLKSNLEEITIDDIYKELDIEDKNEIKETEIALEKNFCQQNKPIYDIYNYCLKENKKVFFTSDMYLDREVVEEILNKAGYNNYNLYLSSNELLKKRSGNLFKKLIKDNNIKNDELLHIGDSFISDYLRPKLLKINSILIKRVQKNTLFNVKNNNLDYNILSSFLNNNQYQNNTYQHLGYEVLGPILYSFTSWIHQKVKEDKIDKIYFLARDAKIIMEVYKQRYNEEIPIYYLNVSRKSILSASLVNVANLNDILTRYKSILNSTVSVSSFLQILNLDINNYKEILNKNKISLDMKVVMLKDNLQDKLFNIIKAEVIKNSKQQNDYLKKYLEQNKMSGNIALVDIGWNGTIQYYLKDFSKANMHGYYYGVNKDKKYSHYKIDKKGYLFDSNKLDDEQIIMYLNIGFFEIMFLALEGTTLAYEMKNNNVYPILDKEEYSNVSAKIVNNIQKSAKDFVEDVNNSNIINYFNDMDKNIYFKNFKEITINPTLKIIRMFKNIEFKNISVTKLVDNKSIFYYLIHPKNLLKDFINTGCKVWFIKNIFKIKLPYYNFLKKMYIKKKSL